MAMANQRFAGVACMLVSSFFFAVIGAVIKMAGPKLGVWQISFYRAVIGILLMLVMTTVFKVRLMGPNKKLLTMRGVTGTAGFLCLVAAMQLISLAEAMVLFFLFPVFAALLSSWINNERLVPAQWPFLVTALLGTTLVIWPGSGFHPSLGHFFALASAVFAGVNTALVRKLAGGHGPYTIYFFFCLVAVFTSIWPLAMGSETLLPLDGSLWYLLAIGVAATVGQVLMNQGFYFLPAAEGGVVLMSQVIIAGSFGVIFFDEPLTWRLAVGGTLIMAGGAFLNRFAVKRA